MPVEKPLAYVGKPVIGTIVMFGLSLALSSVKAEQLNDTMSWALRSSLDIQADVRRQEAAEARVLGAYEAFLPAAGYNFNRILDSHISYNPGLDALPNSTSVIDTIARRDPNTDSLQLSLPLFDGFKRINELRAARSSSAAGLHIHADKRQQVLLDTASAYLGVLRDRTIVALREAELADLQVIARTITTKLMVHDATLADAALADSRVAASRSTVDQARADLASAEDELNRLAGASSNPTASPRVPEDMLPKTTQELQRTLAALNPKILASRLDSESADYRAKAAYARFLPQLNFLFSKSKQGSVSNFAYNVYDTTALLQLKVPLYDPGEFSNLLGERAVAQQKAYESLDLEQKVITQATIAFTQHQSKIAQIRQAKSRVAQLAKAVKAQRVAKGIGLATVMDVLNTVGELAEAKIALARLEYERDQSTYALLAALNRLSATAS